jgi:hypothetical protein
MSFVMSSLATSRELRATGQWRTVYSSVETGPVVYATKADVDSEQAVASCAEEQNQQTDSGCNPGIPKHREQLAPVGVSDRAKVSHPASETDIAA